ncbi:MAG: sulfatase, partial [Candidatus Hydrogenedentota bacterium]
VPFLLSLPLLIFTTRPKREELLEDAAEVRAATRGMTTAIALTPEEVRGYRRKLAGCVFGGALAGLIGGAAFGLWEARWHLAHMGAISDSAAYWWAPLVYGIVCVPLGLGAAAALTFFYLLLNRFAPAIVTFSLSLAGTVGTLGLVIGQFRYKRDVLAEAAMKSSDYLTVGEYAGGAALAMLAAGLVLGYAMNALTRGRIGGYAGIALGMAAYVGLVTVGGVLASTNAPTEFRGEFKSIGAKGPNVILIAVDTLRADFTSAYNKESNAKTPAFQSLATDGVLFQKMFAQSSWTKASFGTIFSGMYPETHSATGKTSALPDEVVTIAETLKDAGYYTKGYSNNPNITSIWNYDQGFADYVDLRPNLYFGATGSCEKLVLYDILRKVVQTAYAKLGGWLFITDFYQPGDVVTDTGLRWIDSPERPKDAPFYLFLHYMDPHDPYRDPDRPGHGYARVRMENPDPEKFKDKLVRAYSYEVEFVDAQIGRLIEGLKSRDLYDDALIVFTADHGEEFHEHGGWWHGLSLYDEQIAVPLIMKLPGNAIKGNTNPGIARSVDIAPTIAEITGAKRSDRWQGIPLFTTDLQPGNGPTEKTYAHLNFEGIELRALRTQDRKLIQSNENKRKYPVLSFFDMVADPGEQVNLADAAERAEEIKKFIETTEAMKAYVLENKAEPSISEAGMEEMKEELESLGYLE